MKLKFAGIIRSLLGQGGNTATARPVSSAQLGNQPAATSTQNYSGPAPDSSGYDSSQDATFQSASKNPDEIGIPLVAIVNALPIDLKAKLICSPAPGKMVFLRVENVISQLAFGAVKISFGELRQLAPGTFVNGINGTFDARQVNLPLNEILSRINPTLLSRRLPAQKFEVAEDIAGPFGAQGRGVSFTAQPLKQPAASPAPPPRAVRPAPPTPPARETYPVKPINFAPPTSPATPSVPKPRQVPVALTPPAKSEPIPFSIRQAAPAAPSIPVAPPSKPAGGASGNNGNGNGNGNGNSKSGSSLPPFKFALAQPAPPVQPSPPAPPAQPAQPAPVPPAEHELTFRVMLRDLAENWPNEMKSEIVQAGLVNASVPLPIPWIEPGLKRGRVTMAWRNLRSLINPDSPLSACDDLELDLPLKVLAPAFLAEQKKQSAESQAQIAVSEEIPNLFFGFPQPDSATPPSTPATPPFRPSPLPTFANPPAESSHPVAQPASQTNSTRITDTNLFSPGASSPATEEDSTLLQRSSVPATDFLSRQMQPKDVVAQALALQGVAGAVVALADGLRVAGEVPPEFNADTVAAFLPQIYERVNQSTRELRMGALNNVSFTVGNVPWKIFRVNSIYFATFGRPGETFPKAQLALLAAGLDRKTK